MEGTGQIIVCAVGKNSFLGKMKLMLQEEQDETPLQQKLSMIADQIGIMGMIAAAFTFVGMAIHLIVIKIINKVIINQFCFL